MTDDLNTLKIQQEEFQKHQAQFRNEIIDIFKSLKQDHQQTSLPPSSSLQQSPPHPLNPEKRTITQPSSSSNVPLLPTPTQNYPPIINDFIRLSPPTQFHVGESSSSQTQTMFKNAIPLNPFKPKLEFPHFDGSEVRSFLRKCTRYFSLKPMTKQQKFDMAAMHMDDRAEI
ncbi:hypothetical protein LIER_07745 [Lithospermum erythrorhizon]|uniref:Uncharacterized protein n=1 Tax=Lithospermum erythrorhizon TaxID=34254 RepID=A0AAV3PAB6_LITER